MKRKIVLLLGVLFVFIDLYSQEKLLISGNRYVEVGFDYTFRAKFDTTGTNKAISKVENYSWSSWDNGFGLEGVSELMGLICNQTYKPCMHLYNNLTLSDEIVVNFGDYDNYNTKGDLSCDIFYIKNGSSASIRDTHMVYIYRVWNPNFKAPAKVQACCSDEIMIEAKDYKDANVFEWEILSGGTIVEVANDKIYVEPTKDNEPIVVTCRVSRQTGHPDYYRENSITISRFTPVTPAYSYSGPFCKGDIIDLCVPEICGMMGVSWEIPPSLNIIAQPNSFCLQVTPNDSYPDGYVGNISYRAIMEGGCNSVPNSSSFGIYSYETPPIPDGTIIVTPQGEINDPCDPESWPEFTVKYITDNPYVNGTTTVTPKVFIPVPHHMNENATILITVCNINYCSGIKTCRNFIYELPYPCEDDRGEELLKSNSMKQFIDDLELSKIEYREDDIKAQAIKELSVFPNPVEDEINAVFPFCENATIEIVDITGRAIITSQINNAESIKLDTKDFLKNGIYIIRLINKDIMFTKKFVK